MWLAGLGRMPLAERSSRDRVIPGVELGMRKHVLLNGLLAGVLIAALKLIEYRWLVLEHSMEIYGGLVAAMFATLGIWLGFRLTQHAETVVVREVVVPAPLNFVRDQSRLEFGADFALVRGFVDVHRTPDGTKQPFTYVILRRL